MSGFQSGSSPHTRGAPGFRASTPTRSRIIPAYAGSTAAPPGTIRHTRGSSPHTRGALDREAIRPGVDRIIPAYAGSTTVGLGTQLRDRDHPRIRGEHVHIEAPRCPQMGSSPHTRGAPACLPCKRSAARIIPAYAGSTLFTEVVLAALNGSSPHTRGAQTDSWFSPSTRRIIPAYAGSTGWIFPGRRRCKDHPRIRGEHAVDVRPNRRRRGSSPHTRGALDAAAVELASSGIIPAYAGSTRPVKMAPDLRTDHPRIRGEHSGAEGGTRRQLGSSPHTRGALALGDHIGVGTGIIPAYAGSTPRARRASA